MSRRTLCNLQQHLKYKMPISTVCQSSARADMTNTQMNWLSETATESAQVKLLYCRWLCREYFTIKNITDASFHLKLNTHTHTHAHRRSSGRASGDELEFLVSWRHTVISRVMWNQSAQVVRAADTSTNTHTHTQMDNSPAYYCLHRQLTSKAVS